jgi:hypothetical protein
MASFDRGEAVRRLIDFAFGDDEPARMAYRKMLDEADKADRDPPSPGQLAYRIILGEDFFNQANFLRNDLGLVLEAYANQHATPASKMPNAIWPCIDHSEFKVEIPHIAYRYALLPALRAKRISDFLCRALLDSEIYPLAREVDNPASVLSNVVGPLGALNLQRHERGSGWTTAGATLLILMAIIFALAGAFVVSVVFVGLVIWIFVSRSNKRKAISGTLGEISLGLKTIHGQLSQIRDEIAAGSYDGATIINRLKVAEASGAYVPSIIYRLLETQLGTG